MKENCECKFCKEGVNEFFCIACGYNFNECEVIHEFDGRSLCPKCHPEKTKDSTETVKELLHKILALLESYNENDCQVALSMASFYLMQKSKETDDSAV